MTRMAWLGTRGVSILTGIPSLWQATPVFQPLRKETPRSSATATELERCALRVCFWCLKFARNWSSTHVLGNSPIVVPAIRVAAPMKDPGACSRFPLRFDHRRLEYVVRSTVWSPSMAGAPAAVSSGTTCGSRLLEQLQARRWRPFRDSLLTFCPPTVGLSGGAPRMLHLESRFGDLFIRVHTMCTGREDESMSTPVLRY